jgi:60 kDa SS-A/Ro ribonucleoprotein
MTLNSELDLRSSGLPNAPMAMLTSLPLERKHWEAVALNSSWQTTRMNLNTFHRHGAFQNAQVIEKVAARLRDPNLIAKARVFPYQLMVAYQNSEGVPAMLRNALQDAMEIATRNVQRLTGKIWVLPDVSGSMRSPVTGYRKGSTSTVRCIDVAALIAACITRKCPDAGVLPFSDDAIEFDLNPRDSIMTNANRLASLPSGGTNCSAPLMWLNHRRETGDLVIFVSDNESWIDARPHRYGTQTSQAWSVFKSRSPRARLVCLDLTPNTSTQARNAPDVLNLGGFSDQVFDVIASFSRGELPGATGVQASQQWSDVIDAVNLDSRFELETV